jgi:hypothetical protein
VNFSYEVWLCSMAEDKIHALSQARKAGQKVSPKKGRKS